jgi:heptosyltransferase II
VTIPQNATWVRFPRFVGDAVQQLSILRLLRQMDIGPLVVWGPAATVALVDGHELADAVLLEKHKPGSWEMSKTLRQHQAARSIHFPKSLRPALAAFLARVPERIGVSESLAGPFNTHTASFWKAPGTFMDRYLRVLRKRWPDLPPLPYPDYDPNLRVEAPASPYLCLMPGSVWETKSWPVEHYKALATQASQEGFAVVILGAPSEREICQEVATAGGLDLSGKTNLREAAAWLQGAKGAVGNDSGLSHLAAACNTPIVALYGPTSPEGPAIWGPKVSMIRLENVPCAPCYERACKVPGRPCMAGIKPDRAWMELKRLMQG